MKVLMAPGPRNDPGTSGLDQVIYHYTKYLPEFGVKFAAANDASYDLRVAHAGAVIEAEVAHNHGLYWTADYDAPDMEYKTNANVIKGLRYANQVTVPSHWVAEAFQRDMRFTPHVIPHGIEWKDWAHNQPHDNYVLWNKNRTTDVCSPDVIRDLAKTFSEVQFITTFAPEGSPYNVRRTGVLPHKDMKPLVQLAGVYLATTKETFGIGILEALASGVPVLGYAHGGILDIVEHKVNGFLAQPGNIEDLITGLLYCFKHRESLSVAARDSAQSFSWLSVCEQVAQVYELALQPDPPTCAIVIPSYNYSSKVTAAIQSAMTQDYDLLTDIVIVDDGSQDDGATESVVNALAAQDHRIRYIRQSNMGVAHARNNGIAFTNTKYIACLDADDQLEPNFLSTLIPPMEHDPSLGITYSTLRNILPNGRSTIGHWPGKYNFDEQLKFHNQVPTCCVFRRKMWERLGGYRQRYSPKGAGAEDAELWLRAGAYGFNAQQVTTEPLFIYSLGTGRVSGDHSYHEINWLTWHPWTRDNQHPFASIATPKRYSHPVRQYDEPLISVIIPVGPGHEHMLIDALDSLEAQTFRKWEAIVINDTGHSLSLPSYPYTRIVTTPGRKGAGYARNRGIEATRAPLFLCLDADDYLQSQALEYLYQAHLETPDAWIYPDMIISEPSGIIKQYFNEDWDVETLWRKGIASVTCLYQKSHWQEVNGYDETPNAREDWDFHLRLARAGICGERLPIFAFTYRHGTGTGEGRRKDQIDKDGKVIRPYTLEELKMACSGCKKKRAKTAPTPAPTNWEVNVAMQEGPLIEYTGTLQDFKVRAPSRRSYIFGNNQWHRIVRIHPDDAAFVLSKSYFRRVDDREISKEAPDIMHAAPVPKRPQPVQAPAPKPTPKPTPEPVESAPAPAKEPKPKPTPEPEKVEPKSEEEDEPEYYLEERPDVEVPFDITEMTVMELYAYHTDDLSNAKWAALWWDEYNRDDGITPRKVVLKKCATHSHKYGQE